MCLVKVICVRCVPIGPDQKVTSYSYHASSYVQHIMSVQRPIGELFFCSTKTPKFFFSGHLQISLYRSILVELHWNAYIFAGTW